MARYMLVLRELYQITERRDNSVYKTKYICDIWIDPDQPQPQGFQFVNVSDPDVETIGTLITPG